MHQGLRSRPGVGEYLVISRGDVCTILDFARLPKSQGGHLLVTVEFYKEGASRIAEIFMIPNYNLPGKNEAERTEYEMRNKDDHFWELLNE